MKTLLVDTNIIVRFLLSDHKTLSTQARTLFTRAQEGKHFIYLDDVVIAEVVWVLSSFYRVPRADIAIKLEQLIGQDWIENSKKSLILQALSLYRETTLHYIDCWLLATAKKYEFPLETFDRKLKRAYKQ